MGPQVQSKCFRHLQHMRNNWELRKRGYLIRFGHTEALLLKKYDIKWPFSPPCRNWPICTYMRWKTDQVCETRFATQKKVKLTGSRKTNIFNQKRQEWTAKTPAQAAPRPEAEEVFWSLPTPWGRRASLGNSTWLSPCWSSWRRWRCLWWWRSTRRSPWPASTTCPTGSTWSGCRQTLTRQTWRTPQTRKRVFLLLYIAGRCWRNQTWKCHQQTRLGDILPQGHFAPLTFCPKDILPQDILPQLS